MDGLELIARQLGQCCRCFCHQKQQRSWLQAAPVQHFLQSVTTPSFLINSLLPAPARRLSRHCVHAQAEHAAVGTSKQSHELKDSIVWRHLTRDQPQEQRFPGLLITGEGREGYILAGKVDCQA